MAYGLDLVDHYRGGAAYVDTELTLDDPYKCKIRSMRSRPMIRMTASTPAAPTMSASRGILIRMVFASATEIRSLSNVAYSRSVSQPENKTSDWSRREPAERLGLPPG
jgi:hypothetical protein